MEKLIAKYAEYAIYEAGREKHRSPLEIYRRRKLQTPLSTPNRISILCQVT